MQIAIGVTILIMLYYIFIPHRNSFYALGWKSLSSLCFVLWGSWAYVHTTSEYALYILIGLCLGAIGDVLLALPYCYPQHKERFFLGGLSAFLLGHLAYVAALFHMTLIGALLAAGLAVLIGCGLIRVLSKQIDFQGMKPPVMLYAAVILFMELQALTWVTFGTFGIVLNLGTLAFVLSDLILLFIIFDGKDSRRFLCANLSCYYVAQMALVMTTLLMGK